MTKIDGHTIASRNASEAKGALERVCSGAGLDPPSRYYGPTFVDHVNDLEFHGLEGARRSVDLYKSLLPDMAIRVEEQTVDGDLVASRFVVTGTSYGRRVRFSGITLSRFEGGLIVEDWSVTDTLGMLRQLGLWRSVLVGLRQWRALAAAAGAPRSSVTSPSCSVASKRVVTSGAASA
jgi:predicted ester cyclase